MPDALNDVFSGPAHRYPVIGLIGRTPNPAVVPLATVDPPPPLLWAVRRWFAATATFVATKAAPESERAAWARTAAELTLLHQWGCDHHCYVVDGALVWARFGGAGLPIQVCVGPAAVELKWQR